MKHCKLAVLVRLEGKASSHFSDTEEMACQSSTSQVPYPCLHGKGCNIATVFQSTMGNH